MEDAPYATVLWYLSRRPDGTWDTHLSVSSEHFGKAKAVQLHPDCLPRFIDPMSGEVDGAALDRLAAFHYCLPGGEPSQN